MAFVLAGCMLFESAPLMAGAAELKSDTGFVQNVQTNEKHEESILNSVIPEALEVAPGDTGTLPTYTFVKQEEGKYQAVTEDYTLNVLLEQGFCFIRGSVSMNSADINEEGKAYGITTRMVKYDGTYRDRNGEISMETPHQFNTGSFENDEYRFLVLLKDKETGEDLAVFEGIELSMDGNTSRQMEIYGIRAEEDRIIMDIENPYPLKCFYAPSDGSTPLKEISIRDGWREFTISGLTPATEYSFEFVNPDNNATIDNITYKTADPSINVSYEANASLKNMAPIIEIRGEAEGYEGTSGSGFLDYEYTDAVGNKEAGSTYITLNRDENGENNSFYFSHTFEERLPANTTVELSLALRIDGITYGKKVITVNTPSSFKEEDIQFIVEPGDSERVARVMATINNNAFTVLELFYRMNNDTLPPLEHTPLTMIEGEFITTINNIQPGTEYTFLLLVGGVKKEVTTVIGTAPVTLIQEEEKSTKAYNFIRNFKLEPQEGTTPDTSYTLAMRYRRDGETEYTDNGVTVELNQENGYKASYSTAEGGQLIPDTGYYIKWVLMDQQGLEITTLFEEVQTGSVNLDVRVEEELFHKYSIAILPKEDNFSDFISFGRFPVFAYYRQKGSGRWINAAGTSLDTVNLREMTVNFNGLKENTEYEFYLSDSYGNIYYQSSFITKADDRMVTVDEVVPAANGVSLSVTATGTGIQGSYVHIFIREKKEGEEWKTADHHYCSTDAEQYTIELPNYSIEEIKEDTTYEYIIGFGKSYSSTVSELHKTVGGEFTTLPDARNVTAQAETGYTVAKIQAVANNNIGGQTTVIHLFYKEKSETTWQKHYPTHSFTSSGSNTVDFSIKGLRPATVYEYVVVISDTFSLNDPDAVTSLNRKAPGEFTTKTNPYTLDLLVAEDNVTDQSAVIKLNLKGEGADNYVDVTLKLESGEEADVRLYSKNNYSGEIVFERLSANKEYKVIEADIKILEENSEVTIGTLPCLLSFKTKAPVIPIEITLDRQQAVLNAAYTGEWEDGFDSLSLTATLHPENASYGLTWESSNPGVARVTEDGIVEAVSAGEAIITVSSIYDENRKASCNVIVKSYAIGYEDKDGKLHLSRSLGTRWHIYKDQTMEKVGYYNVSGNETPTLLAEFQVTPENTGIVSWEEGALRGENPGSTKVIFEKDGVKAYIEAEVSVAGKGFGIRGLRNYNGYPAVVKEDGTYILALKNGEVYQAVGHISPNQPFEALDFSWKIENEKIATVNEQGVITPIAKGITTLTVTPVTTPAGLPYIQSEITLKLEIRNVVENIQKETLYALSNTSTTIGDVSLPTALAADWDWRFPQTPLVTNGVYTNNSYNFEIIYTGDEFYPGRENIEVYIGKITGATAYQNRKVVETGGEDRIVVEIIPITQGYVSDSSYEIELPAVAGLTYSETGKGEYTIAANSPGKYLLKPVVKTEGRVAGKTTVKLTSVNEKQVRQINLATSTEGISLNNGLITFDIADKKSFDLKAEVLDRLGAGLDTKLQWKITDSSVASIKTDRKNTHQAEILVRGEGHAVITVSAKDKAEYQVQMDLEIRNRAPRVDTLKAEVNAAYDYNHSHGKSMASTKGLIEIVPVYGSEIAGVSLWNSSASENDSNLSMTQYSGYKWLVTPAKEDISTGKYQTTLRVETTEGEIYDYPLQVVVINKVPKVSIKSYGKLNLFYTDSIQENYLSFTGIGNIENITWEDRLDGEGNGFTITGSNSRYFNVEQEAGLQVVNGKPAGSGVAEGMLSIKLTTYKSPVIFDNYKIKYHYKKPGLVTSPATTVITPEAGIRQKSFQILNKSESYLTYSDKENASSYIYSVIADNNAVILRPSNNNSYISYTYEGNNKKENLILKVDSHGWRESLTVKHKIKTVKPKASLYPAKVTINNFERSVLESRLHLKDHGYWSIYSEVEIKGSNSKSQKLLDEDLLMFTFSGHTISINQNYAKTMGTVLPPGNYKFKVTPYYKDVTTDKAVALNTVTLTVKVIDRPVTAKVTPRGSIDLAHATYYDVSAKRNCFLIDPVFKNMIDDYTVTERKLVGEYSDYFRTIRSSGHDILTVSSQGVGKLRSGQSYRLAVEYTIQNNDGDTFVVTSNTFAVKPKQSSPKINVTNNRQVLYAGAERLSRNYSFNISYYYYTIESIHGSVDVNKDGRVDLQVSGAGGNLASVRITDRDAVVASGKGKSYTIPVTVTVRGRDGIMRDAKTKITVIVKR